MDQQREKRIVAALRQIAWLQAGLQFVPCPPNMRGELQKLLTALGTAIALGTDRESVHAMITATKLDLYKKTENTVELTEEQKEYYEKGINLILDGIEYGLEGALFVDWSIPQG